MINQMLTRTSGIAGDSGLNGLNSNSEPRMKGIKPTNVTTSSVSVSSATTNRITETANKPIAAQLTGKLPKAIKPIMKESTAPIPATLNPGSESSANRNSVPNESSK